ncbi:MAG TPA: prepilin-type N-terminal cleavage/methylation domain-containing protein [Pirellulaceae bacterium]|jgi:prepilin-type N-terminal cleavage/methylation domain-containing protein|nr:prepilin-type N-terminal cleavage/methylation domain-containing protein [Pirellulaceae bacterium]
MSTLGPARQTGFTLVEPLVVIAIISSQVSLCDGSVRFVPETVDGLVWEAAGSRNGFESLQLP